MQYILHNYRRCPFCIRVRILLHLKQIEYEVVEEPLRKWTLWMKNWSEQTGERSRIPVLRKVDSNGSETIFTESHLINLMLDMQNGEPKYTPPVNSDTYQQMQSWVSWCDDDFKHRIDRFKYGEDLHIDPATHPRYVQELQAAIQELEAALTTSQYLLGDTLTLADIAIIPFVRQIMRTRGGEFDFTDFPKTATWTNDIIETDWFQNSVMKKYPLANSN